MYKECLFASRFLFHSLSTWECAIRCSCSGRLLSSGGGCTGNSSWTFIFCGIYIFADASPMIIFQQLFLGKRTRTHCYYVLLDAFVIYRSMTSGLSSPCGPNATLEMGDGWLIMCWAQDEVLSAIQRNKFWMLDDFPWFWRNLYNLCPCLRETLLKGDGHIVFNSCFNQLIQSFGKKIEKKKIFFIR